MKTQILTLTKVPACCKTCAASFPDALIHSTPFISWTSDPVPNSGKNLVPTYGGLAIWSGTDKQGDTFPGCNCFLLTFRPAFLDCHEIISVNSSGRSHLNKLVEMNTNACEGKKGFLKRYYTFY